MKKIDQFKESFSEFTRICYEMDILSINDAVDSISMEVEELKDNEEVKEGIKLMEEIMYLVNGLDMGEYGEGFEDTVQELNDMFDDMNEEFSAFL